MRAVAAAAAMAILGCGRQVPGIELRVRAEFAEAQSVRCVRIHTAGATRAVSRDFSIESTPPTFLIGGVPTGEVVVTGTAFDLPCAEVTTQDPSWIATPVVQTLVPGVAAALALAFHPNGMAAVSVQFEGAAGAPPPPEAACLRLDAVGATRTVERTMEIGADDLALTGLPTGDVLFIADAFPSCGLSPGPRTWFADAVRATLAAGIPAAIALRLHRSPETIAVAVSPAAALLDPAGTLPFKAVVNGAAEGQSLAVTWSVQEGQAGGSVDASGNYTAPAADGTYHLVATSAADPTKSSTATVTVDSATVLGADRRTVWSPGLMAVGGIPARSTICARVDAFAFGNGAVDASADIQAAIDRCPEGQVVQLSAGTFTVDNFLLIRKAITLRGAGGGVTFLVKTNGAQIGQDDAPDRQPLVIVGPNRFPKVDDATSQDLAVDGEKGAWSVTVADGSGFAPGQIVLLDELSGASWQPDRLGRGMIWASPDYRVVWQLHDPPQPIDDPLLPTTPTSGDAASWFSRQDRVTAEMKEVTAVAGNVVSFSTPLHIGYRASHAAQLTRAAASDVHVRNAGVEDLTAAGGSDGAILFANAAYSWLKGVEVTRWLGDGISLWRSFRIEVRDSFVHDAVWAQPGGAGYAISLAAATADALVENNISVMANKVMVARCAGAGSVFGYNYVDDGYINTFEAWIEIGLNASHMVGPHHVLFEGNSGFNWDSDHTHGNSIFHTVFRNHLRGIRRPFTNPFTGNVVDDATQTVDGPRRCIGATAYSYWMSFVGNVLGAEGQMTGWTYDVTGRLGMTIPAIWLLGWDDAAPQPWDAATADTAVRHGNFDYLTNSVAWSAGSQVLPESLYLARMPSFFESGSGYVWPWVDPVGSTKLHTLPAKARFDAGTPFAQP